MTIFIENYFDIEEPNRRAQIAYDITNSIKNKPPTQQYRDEFIQLTNILQNDNL